MSKSKSKAKKQQAAAPAAATEAKPADKNQGEGNREAARHYNDAATKFADSDQVADAAKRAKELLDEQPVESAQAEADALAGPHPVKKRVEELILEGKAMVKGVTSKVSELLGKPKNPVR